ncbi:hypothetical protein RJ641_029150 [Dillenia turbinata]|uniref:Transmembrane protein n=1 Tax=Dillenia turbinata TaxID=194707 RepID=A0AAN8VXP0_9MAGN
MEISERTGHLLLKLRKRKEDIFGRRIGLKESRMDLLKIETSQLCCFFFIFHGFYSTKPFRSLLLILKRTLAQSGVFLHLRHLSLLVIVFLVQLKLFRYLKAQRQLQGQRNYNRALT